MRSLINKSTFLIVIMAFFIACAPNRAMTKNSDGVAGHSGMVKSASASEDTTYADDEDFDVDDVELETAEKASPAKVKSSGTKTAAKKPSVGDGAAVTQSASGSQQKGTASWYGREFHGKKTASGEKFNMNDLTAAHKTFPLGSIALVKNLDNGKSVKVRINDRGPFAKNRVIDLSYAAAKKIDMVSSGEARVSITLIGAAAKDYSLEDSDDGEFDADAEVQPAKAKKTVKTKGVASSSVEAESDLALQTGAFHTRKNAEKMKSRLEELLPGKDVLINHDGAMYKVKVSGIATRKEAEKCKRVLSSEEIDSFISGQE